ncbi:hypothetical protein Ahy_A06g027885 [Arachis hypogaea]|uniref:Uncharacterized protein n=1 Tax=Arachis hypogaea TaxID=3818 RepID=A0A445CQ21_ARAHY|nr:hypothetical protein Ahy_A06g027885 [Arachis hypogaea]
MSIKEDDVNNDSDNDLGVNFDYQPNAEDDADDDDVDSLDSTSKSEEVCGVKRIADLMVEDIWNLEFRTEDEACQIYNAYSCWHGFVMKKDDVVRDNQGRIISRQLVCNKEGWRNMRYLDMDDRSREARSLTRTKCPARLRIKLDYGCGRWKTVIFGSGLLSDETTETYKWLLETFVEAMGGKSPKAVITDGDLAMRDAIKNGLIYDNNDQRDFDRRRTAILDKHNLVGSTWMEKTYETREMWSHCFLWDKFFGYIRTTSQCEGINSLIRFYVNRKNTLIDFMHNLDRALKEYRNKELIADFKSQCSEPVMITSLEVYERSASCYFMRNVFKEIRNEIQRAGALNITVLSTTLDKVEFSVTALGDPAKDRRVEVDRGKNLFSCSCKLFESRGIPCSHIFCAMKFENILEFPDSLIYKRWTKNAKNEFISTDMPVNDDIERVLKFQVGALASNCNKLCDIACKDLADFDEVQSELVNLVIRLQSRKQGKSTPNVNVEGSNDPFVVKSKGAPSKRSSWRKKRACSNCHKYGHYYKRCPDLMQHSVEGNPRDRSYGNASAKDSGFSPERFANSSRSFSIKSEHHSGPNTKPFKKGGTRKFTATGMRNRKGKDNTFVEVKESQQDKRHSFKNYECVNDVVDDKCDTRHVQIDVRDPLTSSLPCGNKQGSYMALFASMHRTL